MKTWIAVCGLFLGLLFANPAAALSCRTITLPDSQYDGGAVTAQPGSNYFVYYQAPPGTSSVGLEFWFHAFPGNVPISTQYILVYLNEFHNDPRGKRIFHAANVGPEGGTWWGPAFPMSTFVHPGEEFIVNWYNTLTYPVDGYLIVTIRECWP